MENITNIVVFVDILVQDFKSISGSFIILKKSKTTFNGRRPLREVNLKWKKIFDKKNNLFIKNNLRIHLTIQTPRILAGLLILSLYSVAPACMVYLG